MRRRYISEKKLFTERFYPGGTYTWIVPEGCTEVDVFLVGAGGGAGFQRAYGPSGGGGGGYTKTFKSSTDGWRDGDSIKVSPGQSIQVIVGSGVSGEDGGYSQFMNSNYRAEGGKAGKGWDNAGNGGSGGGGTDHTSFSSGDGGSDGSNGQGGLRGKGQGHTTRDFGEPNGKRNSGGGSSIWWYENSPSKPKGGVSDYTEGTPDRRENYIDIGESGFPGGGYGGGAAPDVRSTYVKGGDGTVLIRYYAYEK
jgi:hypothetical protein